MPLYKKIFIFLTIIILIFLYLYNKIKKKDGYEILECMNKLYTPYITPLEYYSTDTYNCNMIKNNWKIIKNEYESYVLYHKIYRLAFIDPEQLYIDTSNIPWNAIILRAYNKDTNLVKYFPHTVKILSNIKNCTTAYFSILYPGKLIPLHTGVFKGVLRYHLGLKVPSNKENCYIVVNNKKKIWEEGSDFLFDDTYPHYVYNNTNEIRVILLLDIIRPFNNIIIDSINRLFLKTTSHNINVDKVVNKVNELDKI